MLEKCASTALSSKLIAHQKDFFSKMVVDAVMLLDELLPLNMIGIKKVQGGSLEVCRLRRGSPHTSQNSHSKKKVPLTCYTTNTLEYAINCGAL